MVINHREAKLAQTNSILLAYTRDMQKQLEELSSSIGTLNGYYDRVVSQIKVIKIALNNYYKAANLLYKLMSSCGGAMGIAIDWSKTNCGKTYAEVISYDINN